MRTNTVLIRIVFIGILCWAGYVLDPVGARYLAEQAAASQQDATQHTPTSPQEPTPTSANTRPAELPRPTPSLGGIPTPLLSSLLALLIAVAIILFEMRIQQASLKTLIGAAVGSITGIVGGVLIGFLISYQESSAVHGPVQTFLTLALAFIMARSEE